jgi:hypothetical protein
MVLAGSTGLVDFWVFDKYSHQQSNSSNQRGQIYFSLSATMVTTALL